MINPMMMSGPMQGFGGANNGTNNVNPLSLLTSLQIGKGSPDKANADWNLPQTVRMGLTGMLGRTELFHRIDCRFHYSNGNSLYLREGTDRYIFTEVVPTF